MPPSGYGRRLRVHRGRSSSTARRTATERHPRFDAGGLVLQAIRGWAVADLRAWPREHRKVRLVLVLGGLEAASFGWVAVALLGVPANVPSTKVRLEAGSSLWFALGLLVVLLLAGGPHAFYVPDTPSLSAVRGSENPPV